MTILILLSPTFAVAGDAGCVWRALPETFRTTALKAYAEERVQDLLKGVDDDTYADALDKCVAMPKGRRDAEKTSGAVAFALAAYVMQIGSEAYLLEHLKIEATTLERAYGTVPPKRRGDFATMYLSPEKTPSKAVLQALVDAIRTAHPGEIDPDSKDFDELYMYFAARALREQNEAKF